MSQTLTTEIIHAAIDGYEAQKARSIERLPISGQCYLENRQKQLRRANRIVGSEDESVVATRARMAEGQRRRWAAARTQGEYSEIDRSEISGTRPEEGIGRCSPRLRVAVVSRSR